MSPSAASRKHNLEEKNLKEDVISLTNLPKEIVTCFILPVLDHFSLANIAVTSKGMMSLAISFLSTNKTLNMIPVSRRIEMGTLSKAADRKKSAFAFLTRNATVSCLRKIHIDDHLAMPVANISTIKKLIRINKNLEELTLVNMKLTIQILDLISKLPRLRYLKLSPDICADKDDRFSDFMEALEKKGCDIQLHYNYF